MPRWIYHIEEVTIVRREEDIEEELNELGEDGWEAVGVTAAVPVGAQVPQLWILFKKQK